MDPSVVLRPPKVGDMGWIVHRQALLYAEEYGWNVEFEGLIAGIVSDFLRDTDPASQRCWIAERNGEVVGSIFLVRETDAVAKLRLLYIERAARGLGIGSGLVAECIRAARALGYRRITLWTNDILLAARHIYLRAGFTLVAEEKHHSFGHDLVGQNWALDLHG